MPDDEMVMLKDGIVSQLAHLKVYLFGSYAYGNPSPHSDYWLKTIIRNDRHNLSTLYEPPMTMQTVSWNQHNSANYHRTSRGRVPQPLPRSGFITITHHCTILFILAVILHQIARG